ncbi:hypothetical protein F8388_011778, partial [Cannabis sativa]
QFRETECLIHSIFLVHPHLLSESDEEPHVLCSHFPLLMHRFISVDPKQNPLPSSHISNPTPSIGSSQGLSHSVFLLHYQARCVEAKVGVNKPELLPKEFTTVIDVAGFLSDGQEKRLAQEISNIEKETGFKLRVLAQNYPDTPGLAIRDFWQVDDRTIVFVADPTFGNILNFNVGASVDLDVPQSFWSRLAGKYGNIFYWKEKGEDASIEAAVMAISSCLKEPVGPSNCSDVK